MVGRSPVAVPHGACGTIACGKGVLAGAGVGVGTRATAVAVATASATRVDRGIDVGVGPPNDPVWRPTATAVPPATAVTTTGAMVPPDLTRATGPHAGVAVGVLVSFAVTITGAARGPQPLSATTATTNNWSRRMPHRGDARLAQKVPRASLRSCVAREGPHAGFPRAPFRAAPLGPLPQRDPALARELVTGCGRVLRDAYRRVVIDELQDLGDGWIGPVRRARPAWRRRRFCAKYRGAARRERRPSRCTP